MRGIRRDVGGLAGGLAMILACGSSEQPRSDIPESITQAPAVEAAPERDLKLTGEWWLQRSSPDGGEGLVVCRSDSNWEMWSFAADGSATQAADPSLDGAPVTGASVTGTFTTHNGVLTLRYIPSSGVSRGFAQVLTAGYQFHDDKLVIGEESFVHQGCDDAAAP